MTLSSVPSAVPVADANAVGPETPEISAISTRARGQRTTLAREFTESSRQLADDWAPRIAAARSAKVRAHLTWELLCAEVALIGWYGGNPDPIWQQVHLVVDRIRVAQAPVIAHVIESLVPPAWGSPCRLDDRYPSRAERVAQRVANRARFWAGQYRDLGGTPEKDARVSWSRLLADVAKVDKAEGDPTPAWVAVRRDLEVIRGAVAAARSDDEEGQR